MSEPWNTWSDDLTDPQLRMLMASTVEQYGVELRGSAWATARRLKEMGLGYVSGDPGASLPGMFFANEEGVRILREFEPDPGDEADAAFDAFFEKLGVLSWRGAA